MCRPISFSNAPRFNSNRRLCRSNLRSRSSRAGSVILGLTLDNDYRFRPAIGKARSLGGQAASSSDGTGTSQELVDLAEESGRFRVGVLGRQALEFSQQFALPLGQLLRRLD